MHRAILVLVGVGWLGLSFTMISGSGGGGVCFWGSRAACRLTAIPVARLDPACWYIILGSTHQSIGNNLLQSFGADASCTGRFVAWRGPSLSASLLVHGSKASWMSASAAAMGNGTAIRSTRLPLSVTPCRQTWPPTVMLLGWPQLLGTRTCSVIAEHGYFLFKSISEHADGER